MTSSSLFEIYQNVAFIGRHDFEAKQFAIITAHNPLGRVLRDEQNEDLTLDFRAQIKDFNHAEIIGASKDLSHQELSFCIEMDKQAAMTLASSFLQNAIYWVDDNELTLVPVLMPGEEKVLGKYPDFFQPG